MRAGLGIFDGLSQRDHAADLATSHIKFGDTRGIPEADVSRASVFCDYDSIGKAAGDLGIKAEIKAVQDISTLRLEQNRLIGQIVSDEQQISARIWVADYSQLSREWNQTVRHLAPAHMGALALRNRTGRNFEEALRGKRAVLELVNGDSVSSIACATALRIAG